MILEGEAQEERDRAALERFAETYDAKYGYRPDPDAEGPVVYVLRPRVAQTWDERDYSRTATRWVFSG